MSETKVSLADEAGVRRIVTDTVFRLWESVNDLSRLEPTRRERYRVTMFGSARTKPGHWVYAEVRRMAGELAAELTPGPGSFKVKLFDCLDALDEPTLADRRRVSG